MHTKHVLAASTLCLSLAVLLSAFSAGAQPAQRSVSGQVLDSSLQSFPEALKLVFVPAAGGSGVPAAVGADGEFHVELSPGDYTVRSQPPMCGASAVSLTVPTDLEHRSTVLLVDVQFIPSEEAATAATRPGAAANTLIDVVDLLAPREMSLGFDQGSPTLNLQWQRDAFTRVPGLGGLPGGVVVDTDGLCWSPSAGSPPMSAR